MKFCLVYLSNQHDKSFILHETQSKYDGKLPPLTLMTVAAAVEKAGHEAKLIDCNVNGFGADEVLRDATEWGADAIGFSLYSSNFAEHLSFIRKIKATSDMIVIAGGRHLSYYPMETMSHREIDYGVVGEGDVTIGELLDALDGKRDIATIDGIVYRDGDRVVQTAPRALVAQLDDLSYPARHLVDSAAYFSIVSPRRNFTLSMLSRGCPHNCIFCDVGRTTHRHRSVASVVDEMRTCREKFGVRFIDFQDSTFNANIEFTKELCSGIADWNRDIQFMARARANSLDDELVRLLKNAGCFLLMIGIESGDPRILKRIRKNISTDDVRGAVSLCKKHGIGAMGYFVIGLPGDTRETVENTISFSISVGLDYAQYTKLLPMPNSDLYMELMGRTGIDYWKAFTLNPTSELNIPLLDTELSTDEVDKLLDSAYKRFYLRFAFILRRLMTLHGPGELLRYIRAARNLMAAGKNSK